MSNKSETTGWIQTLNKNQIIEELKCRGIPHNTTESFNDLRDRLRQNIKSAIKAANVQVVSDESDPETEKEHVADAKPPEEVKSETDLSTQTTITQSSSDDEHNTRARQQQQSQTGYNTFSLESDSDEEFIMSSENKFAFQLESGDWEIFSEKMECFFLTKNITEDKIKVATLVTRLDNDAHALLKQLVAPAKITEKQYKDLIETMTDQLAPKPAEAMERCTFHTAMQESQESIAEFTARLKKLALNCNFDSLNTALRDQLVCGIKDKETRIRLFEEKNLTFEKAQDIATTREAAVTNANTANSVLEKKTTKEEMYAIHMNDQRRTGQRGYTKPGQRSNTNNSLPQRQQSIERRTRTREEHDVNCYRCGRQNHPANECRFRNYNCNYCQKRGHLEQVCRKKAADNTRPGKTLNMITEADEEDEPQKELDHLSDFFAIEISTKRTDEGIDVNKNIFNQIEKNKRNNVKYNHAKSNQFDATPMFIDIVVNEKKVKMEIDTGSYATVFSKKFYDENFSDTEVLQTTCALKAYDGHSLKPIGKLTDLKVNFNDKTRVLDCFVLPGAGPALIGRSWLKEFGHWPLLLPNGNKNEMYKIYGKDLHDYITQKYKLLFSNSPGLYNKGKTVIHLKENTRPIALKCSHVAHALKPPLEKEIDRLVSLGHLVPADVSEWATPIVPVLKSNGLIRICGNFKLTLNQFIIIDKYPLHTIDEIFAKLQGGISFSELDMTHQYMQFPVDESCMDLLTIVTHKGLFRYTKIPEGVSPAPADVQRKMDDCLRGIDGVIAYLDNIYVTGRTEEEHILNLEKVCERLEECNLRLNLRKCKFMQNIIEVLGFVIDKNGLHKSASKINAMVKAPRPNNNKELASFLGLVNFYARFLKDRSNKMKPLYDLLNGQNFEWNDACEKSFNWVKNELISPNFLAHYDPKEKIVLACDASDHGLSAILSHRYKDNTERPIAYASKKIPNNELKRAIIDKEAMAIVFGFKKFYQYVFGKEIILRTDNKPLQLILGPRKGIPATADNRLQRYAYYLSGYRYTIEHVKSEANANCDALSRLPIEDDTDLSDVCDTYCSYIYYFEESITVFNCKTLEIESKRDKTIGDIIRYVTGNWPNYDELSCEKKTVF